MSTGVASAHENPSGKRSKVADNRAPAGRGGMVFVQSNDPERNSILAFRRAADGKLTAAGEYPTGGRGGAQKDNPFDPLASQESLVFDRRQHLMIAVNAGSNSVTTFREQDGKLTNPRTVKSGGDFPTSIAVSGKTVYVLNAGGTTNVTGFRLTHDGLRPLPGSIRKLGVTNAAVPLFTDSPPQVGFSPDGRHLLVTTKSKNTIEVFAAAHDGMLSAKPVTTTSAGDVPFSFVFDPSGHLLVTEAAKSGVTSYALRRNGTLDVITPSVESGQQVLCWIARAGKFFYGTNPGSSTISLYTVDGRGKVSIGGKDGVIAAAGGPEAVAEVAAAASAAAKDPDAAPAKAPGAGPIDLAATADGTLLYVQNTLAGTVEGFRVGPNGELTLVETENEGLPAFTDGSGMEGLVVW
ncbi:lactonase family protein [Winogradskya consettensis]|uniref:lactonase family protein n=1 Tax=Winogradskya consettensis TaxID=113560 RepID=UPI001BB2EEF4|nr:beta-propeller fold lactonase family protein [Actinoplanes consettensis]